MHYMTYVIEGIFSLALFFNAVLFAVQAWKIYKEKSARGISFITFSGFLVIQFATIAHGILGEDYLLAAGNMLSSITCVAVIVLALFYRNA